MGQANHTGRCKDYMIGSTKLTNPYTLDSYPNTEYRQFHLRRDRYLESRQVILLTIPMPGDPILSNYKNLPADDENTEFYFGETSSLLAQMPKKAPPKNVLKRVI